MKSSQKLRKLRGKKPRKIVAEGIGVSYSSYMKYERGERKPSDQTKKKIADYYGVPVESIFFK